jgi:glycosyltransferase involved in cell wall biosynthesis
VLVDEYVRRRPRAHDGPLVTVITATYNRSEVLRHALRSALDQSYGNFEVIVAGDACTDDSEEVVASFADPRVRWINLAANTGSQAGPNGAALEIAKGELIAYLGHDDLWRRDHLAVLVAAIERSGADVAHSACDVVFRRGRVKVRRFSCEPLGNQPATSTLMHRRSLYERGARWQDWRETVDAPDTHFFKQLLAVGARHSRVPVLTVVKFPSSGHRNSYRDRPSRDQRDYARRIGSRAFVAYEIVAGILMLPWRSRTDLPFDVEACTEPGQYVTELRRIRGLE